MLRPKQMSKVSVTGSKTVMDDVIECTHELNLVHLTEYDGRWPGFENGDPVEGANEASEKLVTVRSLESILGVEPEDAGPSRIITDETIEEELERVRTEANDLDDRRNELEDDLREVEEQIDAMAPFATLGIDLDLLWGYDSLAVAVGEGDADDVRRALAALDAATRVFAEDGVVAAFAHTDHDALESALVEATFTSVDVPHEEGDPGDHLAELKHRRQQLESKLDTVEDQIEDLRYDAAGFLLAAEEKLSIEVQKAEAPLSFATTDNAFVAEGWIPTERVEEFEAAVADAVGDHADVEELERAAYSRHGHAETTEEVHEDDDEDEGAGEPGVERGVGETPGEPAVTADGAAGEDAPQEATADGGDAEEVRSDGGVVTMGDDDPPVIQDNPGAIKPFEILTKAAGRPNYSEFDPTLVLFLTFPAFFGFMIADVGYGAVYAGIGYYIYRSYDSDAFRSIGIVAAAAGVATAVFGFFFGEIFGLHLITTHFWEGLLGMEVPMHKGLAPNYERWALAWFIVIALVGVMHLNIGYVMEFFENLSLHGAKEAVIETGSWLLALNGLWLFVLSRPPIQIEHHDWASPKPDFIYVVFDQGSEAAIGLGFAGFPPVFEWVGVAMIAAGFVLLLVGPAYELIEFHIILAHPLSYLRIGAELLAEVGLAFAVNLLFWGVYVTHGEHGEVWHFALTHMPHKGDMVHGHQVTEIMFPGLVHMGPGYVVLGLFVLVVGNLIVLALGVMSVGIQAIRLEYFEFFEKFYEGGGRAYDPFGSDREHTDDGS